VTTTVPVRVPQLHSTCHVIQVLVEVFVKGEFPVRADGGERPGTVHDADSAPTGTTGRHRVYPRQDQVVGRQITEGAVSLKGKQMQPGKRDS
jgi:hypothetical protein